MDPIDPGQHDNPSPQPSEWTAPAASTNQSEPSHPESPAHESQAAYTMRPGSVWATGGARRLPVLAIAMALVAVLAGSSLFMVGFTLGVHKGSQPGTPASDDQLFEPFWNTYHAINDRYAGGEVDKKTLVEGAIKGMIASLDDPYSAYLTADEFQQSLQGISGQFEGIGATIGTQDDTGKTVDCTTLAANCRLVVIEPLEGSPALKAGIKAGDVVTAVDGTPIDGLSVDAARDKIRGKKGTDVTLTIVRAGGAPIDVKVTRDVIVQQEVVAKALAGGAVGYVRLSGFSDNAATAFHKQIEEDVTKGITKLVIDLRGNPGGYVTAARSVASEFLDSGTIFWQEDAQGHRTETSAQAGGAATDPKVKVSLLVDKGSASASEIVAGALQDRKRATLVGETTFGKGTVQEWTTLEGAGGYRLTIAKWLTPNQRWIHHIGIKPDVAVTVPANLPAGQDPVLDKAVDLLGTTSSLPKAA